MKRGSYSFSVGGLTENYTSPYTSLYCTIQCAVFFLEKTFEKNFHVTASTVDWGAARTFVKLEILSNIQHFLAKNFTATATAFDLKLFKIFVFQDIRTVSWLPLPQLCFAKSSSFPQKRTTRLIPRTAQQPWQRYVEMNYSAAIPQLPRRQQTVETDFLHILSTMLVFDRPILKRFRWQMRT